MYVHTHVYIHIDTYMYIGMGRGFQNRKAKSHPAETFIQSTKRRVSRVLRIRNRNYGLGCILHIWVRGPLDPEENPTKEDSSL